MTSWKALAQLLIGSFVRPHKGNCQKLDFNLKAFIYKECSTKGTNQYGILGSTANQILKTFLRVCVLQPIKTLETIPGRIFSTSGTPEFGLLGLPVKLLKQFVHPNSVYVPNKINPIHQQSLHFMHITVLLCQRKLWKWSCWIQSILWLS